jgi:hypothetical protein
MVGFCDGAEGTAEGIAEGVSEGVADGTAEVGVAVGISSKGSVAFDDRHNTTMKLSTLKIFSISVKI